MVNMIKKLETGRMADRKAVGDPAILYFGNDWFAENRTSSHQLARQLAKHHRV